MDRRRKGPDGNDLAADAYVFGDETGKMIKKRWFNRRWRALCDSLKIEDLNFHDLRHESASRCSKPGPLCTTCRRRSVTRRSDDRAIPQFNGRRREEGR